MAAQAGGLVGGQGGTRIAVRCVVTGKVQGVWYRGWTVEQATAAGLDGWVRNRMDGSVEAVFAGRQMVVEAMVENCRHGPPAAQVTDVQVSETDDPGETGFHQKPTV